jgi:hypothetical protein
LTGVPRAGVLARDIEGVRAGVPGIELVLRVSEALRDSVDGGTADQPNRAARIAVPEGGSTLDCCPTASSEFEGILYANTVVLTVFT